MKPIRIFTHAVCEPPGYLITLLDRLGYAYEQVCLYDGKTVPMDTDDISALVFMGGAGSVNEPTDWMQEELGLIKQAQKRGLPILGICLGAQLMSKALGGKVFQSDELEVGWHDVHLLDEVKTHPWLENLPATLPVFQWHAHSFYPPPDSQPIATSDCTECQGFIMGKSLAIQFHLEMTEAIIKSLIEQYGEDLQPVSSCVQGGHDILTDIENKCLQTFGITDLLLTQWFRSLHD